MEGSDAVRRRMEVVLELGELIRVPPVMEKRCNDLMGEWETIIQYTRDEVSAQLTKLSVHQRNVEEGRGVQLESSSIQAGISVIGAPMARSYYEASQAAEITATQQKLQLLKDQLLAQKLERYEEVQDLHAGHKEYRATKVFGVAPVHRQLLETNPLHLPTEPVAADLEEGVEMDPDFGWDSNEDSNSGSNSNVSTPTTAGGEEVSEVSEISESSPYQRRLKTPAH